MDPEVRIGMFVGGIAIKTHLDLLEDEAKRPHIVIGTPGRLLDLTRKGKMVLDNIKYFIVDECDKVLDQAGESLLIALNTSIWCEQQAVFCQEFNLYMQYNLNVNSHSS